MPVVLSGGSLRSLERTPGPVPSSTASRGTSIFDDRSAGTYAAIFRSQPSVRTVVGFLSRNLADLGLHVYRRISDTDRERLTDHELGLWMGSPNPAKTHYRMFEDLMSDMGIYFQAFWLKVRAEERLYFVRMPPETVSVDGWLLPSSFDWVLPDASIRTLAPSEIVYFNGYDPCNPLEGLSPLETLRGVLAEEANASASKRAYNANSSRVEGVITRPKDAPKWTPEQKQAWREQWQTRFAGPANAGSVAVLEDGMSWTSTSFSPRDSEFNESRKLTREEVTRAYHIPLPMVGILDHATFSNIREQHKNLYQDALGPWLTMLTEEIERQILPECDDQDRIYTEFNIDQKLRGSFEEQAAALQTLVGRPVLTLNEGRARLNLPSIKNDPAADKVALPLNMSPSTPGTPALPPGRAISADRTAPVIRDLWRRQEGRLLKLPREERAEAFDLTRWNHELATALDPVYRAAGAPPDLAARLSTSLAHTVNTDTLTLLTAGGDAFAADREAALYGE